MKKRATPRLKHQRKSRTPQRQRGLSGVRGRIL
jgi:hypothetical protein